MYRQEALQSLIDDPNSELYILLGQLAESGSAFYQFHDRFEELLDEEEQSIKQTIKEGPKLGEED